MSGYKHKVIEFYGDPIRFFINGEKVFLGAKSIANGIGINSSWATNKIKNNKNLYVDCQLFRSPHSSRSIICVNRHIVSDFINSFSFERLSNKARFKLYVNEFEKFTYDSVACQKQIDTEDTYLGSKEGIRLLIDDSIVKLGNPNALDQIASVLDKVINNDPFPDKIPYFEKEHCPKTRKAFADLMQELRLKFSRIPDEIYDMAEKTADRQAEIKRYKSQSMQSQIEQIAENIRDIDRKSSLSLKRIAKGIK